MKGALTRFREEVVAGLNDCGLAAVAAFSPEERRDWDGPVTAVTIEKINWLFGGFRDYLGVHTDPESGEERELYGKRMELTVGLDIYARGGEEACREGMENLLEMTAARGLGGMAVQALESGKTEFLTGCGLYRLPIHCRCQAWLAARADDDGEFTDFMVKGRKV